PVRRAGVFADEPALPGFKPFQTPTVAIIVKGDQTKADQTLASIAAQTYREIKVLHAGDDAAVTARLQQATEDVVGLMQAGEVFADAEALTWRVLIPLLKGAALQMNFMWRRPSEYSGD